jgi:hypothetical protein
VFCKLVRNEVDGGVSCKFSVYINFYFEGCRIISRSRT